MTNFFTAGESSFFVLEPHVLATVVPEPNMLWPTLAVMVAIAIFRSASDAANCVRCLPRLVFLPAAAMIYPLLRDSFSAAERRVVERVLSSSRFPSALQIIHAAAASAAEKLRRATEREAR
jgi:hypothetical protein